MSDVPSVSKSGVPLFSNLDVDTEQVGVAVMFKTRILKVHSSKLARETGCSD
jgi:hypothetical protein